MDACTRFDTQIVGALPVISQLLERLRIGQALLTNWCRGKARCRWAPWSRSW